jgi:hypothetical protein
MPQFSLENLRRRQYLFTPQATNTGTVVIPIPPSRPRLGPVVTASEFTARIRNVGISSNAYDITTGIAIGEPDPNVNLGILYSNGYRYQYLAFKGTSVGKCQVIVPVKTVSVQVPDDAGGTTLQDVTVDSSVIITAYVGNAVYPQLPPNNTPTNSFPIPGKVPAEFPNKNC